MELYFGCSRETQLLFMCQYYLDCGDSGKAVNWELEDSETHPPEDDIAICKIQLCEEVVVAFSSRSFPP